MRTSLQEAWRVLRPGGHLVLTLGDNLVCGRRFRATEYIREIAESLGFDLACVFENKIRSRQLMTKRNHTAALIPVELTAVYQKG